MKLVMNHISQSRYIAKPKLNKPTLCVTVWLDLLDDFWMTQLPISSLPHTCTHTPMQTYQCDKLSKDFQDRVDHLDAYCRDKGFHAWFETSAKEDIGIDEAIRCLAAKVLIGTC